MFTGIVEEIGTVRAIDRHDTHARLTISCEVVPGDLAIGDSVAVDGCCLTATTVTADAFTADLMAETLRATSLGDLEVGAPVNLERAMRADTRFGGHLVQGHVDAVGHITGREELPGTVFLTIDAPAEVARHLVAKGSVTVNGTSLTVVDHDEASFRVGLIPHTLEVTTFGTRAVGDRVNLEADVIAKYVARLLVAGTTVADPAVTPYVDTAASQAASG